MSIRLKSYKYNLPSLRGRYDRSNLDYSAEIGIASLSLAMTLKIYDCKRILILLSQRKINCRLLIVH